MAKLIDKEYVIEQRLNSGYSERSALYFGKSAENVERTNADMVPGTDKIVKMSSKEWTNSEGHAKLWTQIEETHKKLKNSLKTNAAQFPSDYYDLIDKLRLDITRRRMQEVDYTGMMNTEIVNPNFSKAVTLDEFLPYVAAFKKIAGTNDSVPLINQKTGGTGSVIMDIYGAGWKDTLENMLYNMDIYSLQKVTDAVARGYIGKRNDLSIGLLPKKTTATAWVASQQVAADTTSGATKEELMYNTLNSAIEKLLSLLDPQTAQEIDAPSLALVCKPTDVRRINRAINGQLNLGGKGKPSNFAALDEITEIWPYRGDTLYWGEEKIVYPGVATNKAYLLVPKVYSWTLVKRGLTNEVGRGSVLQLSTEERAWYFAQQNYMAEFFGSSETGTSLGAGYGAVVEITLPSA